MYRMWESKSKLELFYGLFIEFFLCLSLFVWMEFETIATHTKVI